jgi:hypothetical protein
MSDARTEKTREGDRDRAERVLRAKYLDYCSSQIADHLVRLSPDEIYVLAQEAHRVGGRKARRLTLPTFEQWAVEYEQNPARYDEQLIGLWESELDDVPDA